MKTVRRRRNCVHSDSRLLSPVSCLLLEEDSMCLAIPVRILDISEENGVRAGRVGLGTSFRDACLDLLPEARVGDYVLLHAGFAVSRVDREQAERTYQDLESLGLLDTEPAGTLELTTDD